MYNVKLLAIVVTLGDKKDATRSKYALYIHETFKCFCAPKPYTQFNKFPPDQCAANTYHVNKKIPLTFIFCCVPYNFKYYQHYCYAWFYLYFNFKSHGWLTFINKKD